MQAEVLLGTPLATLTRRGMFGGSIALAGCASQRNQPREVHSGTILFAAKVDDQSRDHLIQQINLSLQGAVNDLDIVLETPGGDGVAAMDMYNFIKNIQNDGVTVRIWNTHEVSSAGCYVFLAANMRYATSDAIFRFHSEGVWVETLTAGQVRIGLSDVRERIRQIENHDVVTAASQLTADIDDLKKLEMGMTSNEAILDTIMLENTKLPRYLIKSLLESTGAVRIYANQALQFGIIQEIAAPNFPCTRSVLSITDSGVTHLPATCN